MTPLIIFGCVMVGAFLGFGLGVFVMAMFQQDATHQRQWSEDEHEQHHV